MSWDQSTGREGVENFLLRELGIDLAKLTNEAIAEKLAEKGLTYEVFEDTSRVEGDMFTGEFHPEVIEFSDGRAFVHALTHTSRGDDWGNDFLTFVEANKPYEIEHEEYLYNPDEDDPHVRTETMPGVSYSKPQPTLVLEDDEDNTIYLSPEEWDRFIEIVNDDSPPNEALKKAARGYWDDVKAGRLVSRDDDDSSD